ncbi:helix-turn-helix domain-containing protein [Pantoea dispersa]|uniref:helix-turn-helix domain-containing protein n=1 Tax=Pantoea dispersa TaxID=59814 RepID=UPI0021F76D41|nr:helix-turn-helix transcriptional regulator [Pantoea dispersa]MCW0321771.1 Antitoxin HigA1 [Pantoea dispersa]MCW0326507.1 Antitoxin HigA1 [Pantoea dispersa]MCW0432933.1 Antitoxin HigA1 [Pantoea dispersa]
MKNKTHNQLHEEMLQDPEYRAAWEAEERKDRMQALLKAWRQHAGLTSAQVAERMGVKPPTVSRMEKNITSASFETIARYAKACGIDSATVEF